MSKDEPLDDDNLKHPERFTGRKDCPGLREKRRLALSTFEDLEEKGEPEDYDYEL